MKGRLLINKSCASFNRQTINREDWSNDGNRCCSAITNFLCATSRCFESIVALDDSKYVVRQSDSVQHQTLQDNSMTKHSCQ